MSLTPEQAHAATRTDCDVGVLASAGSGKTTVLCARYEALVKHQRESISRILVFTFTEKAAAELTSRIEAALAENLLSNDGGRHEFWSQAWIGTIHAFCTRICRAHAPLLDLSPQFSICDSALTLTHYETLIAQILTQTNKRSEDVAHLATHYGLDTLKTLLIALHTQSLASAHFPGDPVGQALLRVHGELQAALAQSKHESASLDFDDLETQALKLLETFPDVRNRYIRQFRHLLVDEFQDLSPAQGRLLELLWQPPKNTLFFVGDPKQAIYGFRGGNVAIFDSFWESLKPIGGSQVILRENWRSAPELVATVNALSTPLFSSNKMAYVPMHAMQSDMSGNVIHHALANSEDTRIDGRRRDEAHWIGTELQQLSAQGLAWREMAVLARSSRFFEFLTPQLDAVAIPYDRHKSRAFMHEPFVLTLSNLLLFLLDPTDVASRIGLERSSFLKNLDPTLHPLFATDPRFSLPSERMEAFRHYCETRQSSPLFTSAYDSFLYFRFLDYLRREEGYGDLSATHFREWLAHLESHSPFAPKKSSAEENKVQLLTVHAAKGLEFEAVFLADLSGRTAAQKKITASEMLDTLELEKKKLELEESKRLFYVALTRAKRFLYFATVPLSAAKEKKVKDIQSLSSWNDWVQYTL